MTVRANSPHTGAVLVMYGGFVFLINSAFHFMTRDTEFQRVGCFHGSVETTPEK